MVLLCIVLTILVRNVTGYPSGHASIDLELCRAHTRGLTKGSKRVLTRFHKGFLKGLERY